MKYAFVRVQTPHFSIKAMCRVLGLARSGYYTWRSCRASARLQRSNELDNQVAHAFAARNGQSGAPRLSYYLQDTGQLWNRKIVGASMRRQRLRAKAVRKLKAATYSRYTLPVAANLLD